MIQERDEDEGYLPPFPDSVMIQLAKVSKMLPESCTHMDKTTA